MATKERLHKLIDELPDTSEAKRRLEAAEHELEGGLREPEVEVEIPEGWRTFDDGTPQPDWTAIIRAQRDHGH